MSLYNLLFGTNPVAPLLLKVLDLKEEDVGRFRDAYLEKRKIVIFTRNGGGNREHWDFTYEDYEEGPDCPCPGCAITHKLPEHSNYVRDYDDDFDSTYAYIEFSIPDKYKELFAALQATQKEPVPTKVGEKFLRLIEELKREGGGSRD